MRSSVFIQSPIIIKKSKIRLEITIHYIRAANIQQTNICGFTYKTPVFLSVFEF